MQAAANRWSSWSSIPGAGSFLALPQDVAESQASTQMLALGDGLGLFKCTIGEGDVIKGWDEGIMKMSLGERGILQIPAAMGYGAQGAGGVIPPNADLYFDVELLAINGKPEKLPEQGYSGKKVAHKDM